MTELKPWWKVATPHSDVKEGKVGAARFAVKLMDVINEEAPREYQDPVTFFNRTYFTRNLKKIQKMVLRRLSEKEGGENVIQLLTHFGGGKSHTLLALYHLFKNGSEVSHMDEVKDLMEEVDVDEIPNTNTCVIVGTYLNPLSGRDVEGDITLHTLWGELAYQLGGKELYKEIKESDEKRISPGEEDLKEILRKAEPFLVLMDELTVYASKAYGVDEYNLHEQTLTFIQELTEVVSSLDNGALLATLPKSPYERAGEAADEMYETAYEKVARKFGRIEEAWTPVEDDEIHEVVRKRLFEDIGDEETIQKVTQKYWDFYLDMEDKVAHDACEPEMKERVKKSYPFHPYLIDILYKRWGSLPRFQRTRGVLRLLALVINDLYSKEPYSPLIHPSDIDFTKEKIKSEVMRYLTDEKWRGVISNDISTVPPKVDKELGSEYEKEGLSVKLARTIFLYSHPSEQAGIDIEGLRAATLCPGSTYPEMVTEIMQRFERVGEGGLWFLDSANGRYFFKTTPGLNKIIVDAEEKVQNEEIDQKIKNLITDVTQDQQIRKKAKIYLHPESPRDIADIPKIGISVLGPDQAIKGGLEEESKNSIQNMLENHKEGARVYKNSLIFVVPDTEQNSNLRKSVRSFLALQKINEDEFVMKQLNENQEERLNRKIKSSEESLPTQAVQTFRYLVKGKKGGGLELIDIGISTPFSENIISTAWNYLQDEGIIYSSLDPALITRKIFPTDKNYIDLDSVWKSFFKHFGLPLPENEEVLKKSIRQGVKLGEFGLVRGEPEEREFTKLFFEETPTEVNLTEEWYIITQEVAKESKTERLEGKEEEEVSKKEEERGRRKEEEEEEETSEERRAYSALRVTSQIPCDSLSDFQRGVIQPLVRNSDETTLEIELSANSEEGIDEDTIERPIKETLRQIKERNEEETEFEIKSEE